MTPILLAALAVLDSTVGLPDRGLWPDLDLRVRIAPPPWRLAEGEGWLRVDATHRVVTLYQGGTALAAFPLHHDGQPRFLAEVLPLLRPEDAEQLRGLLPTGVRVEMGAPTRAEDHDGDGIVDSLDILLWARKLVARRTAS